MLVLTKYICPTNHRGARVQVTLGSGRKVYMPWGHALDAPQMHAKAAAHAIVGADGRGEFVMAVMPDGTPHAYAVTLVGDNRRGVTIRTPWGDVRAQVPAAALPTTAVQP
jgi:hypothetical protein